jgi:hypothetical protein
MIDLVLLVAAMVVAVIVVGLALVEIEHALRERRERKAKLLLQKRAASCSHNVWIGSSSGSYCDDCGAPMPPEPVKKARVFP